MTDDNASFQPDREDAMSNDSEKDQIEKIRSYIGPIIDELGFLRHPIWGATEEWEQAHEEMKKRNEKRKRDAERDNQ